MFCGIRPLQVDLPGAQNTFFADLREVVLPMTGQTIPTLSSQGVVCVLCWFLHQLSGIDQCLVAGGCLEWQTR